jgi:hypothetical protein
MIAVIIRYIGEQIDVATGAQPAVDDPDTGEPAVAASTSDSGAAPEPST